MFEINYVKHNSGSGSCPDVRLNFGAQAKALNIHRCPFASKESLPIPCKWNAYRLTGEYGPWIEMQDL